MLVFIVLACLSAQEAALSPAPAPKKKQQQEQPPPPEALQPQEKPAKPPPEPARFRAGGEFGYNSNIIRLSESEIDELDAGTRPEKYRVKEPDDFIWSPWFEAAMRIEGDGLVGLRAWYHVYSRNSFASHPQLDTFLQLGGGDFELAYSFEHDIYKREYRNLDTDVFESAFYDDHRLDASYRIKASDVVRLKPEIGVGAEDYDAPFNHRDALLFRLGIEGEWRATGWLRFGLEYGFELQNAFASSSQPDTSYQQNGIEAKVKVLPSKVVDIVLAWRIADREYTTSNDPAVDPGHRDRSDDRRRWRLQLTWSATASVLIDVEARFTDVDSDKPHDDNTPEETDWDRDEYILGLRIAF